MTACFDQLIQPGLLSPLPEKVLPRPGRARATLIILTQASRVRAQNAS